MYVETGVDARPIHFRKMFDNVSDAIYDVNKYKSYSNVYHSIWKYRSTEQKYNIYGDKTRIGPDYSSAIIDKVVLDLDAYKKTKVNGEDVEYFTHTALEDARTLEEWADSKNLKRQYRFSGGGLYFIFAAKGHPYKLRDFEINLMNDLHINIDVSTVGDTSRMMRVTNSFNFKPNRKRFCIPLRQSELDLEWKDLRKLAEDPRPDKRWIYGTKTEDFSDCELDKEKINRKKLQADLRDLNNVEEADKILKKYGWKTEYFCDTIRHILNLNHVGNALRIELIKYFKSIVRVSYEDCLKLMVAFLGSEGIHSAREKQAMYAYTGKWVFSPKKLKGLGYCPLDCNECMKHRKILWKVKNRVRNTNRI